MTSPSVTAGQVTPWLSAWIRPRVTIDAVLAKDPRRHVLLLALFAVTAQIFSRLVESKWLVALLDWRVAIALLLIILCLTVVPLFLTVFLFRWTGSLLGGRATSVQLRAAITWGFIPLIPTLPILAVACAVRLFGGNQLSLPTLIAIDLLVLVLALWSSVITAIMIGRVQGFGFWRTIANFFLSYALLLFGALLFRSLLFQPFNLPSGSMKPNLLIGDYVLASKYAYGYSRYSFPFSLPLFSGRILGSSPRYGDVVVFRLPRDPSTDYLKRVVGLPGDRIQMIAGVLHINGVPIKHERIDDFVETDEKGRSTRGRRWRETLPNGVSYAVLDLMENGYYDNTQVYEVPAGHFFVLGDNLDNSQDSRVLSQVGYIPLENLVGRLEMIYFSVDDEADAKTPRVRFDRIGTIVR